jgi:hypothetical protein
MLAISCDTKLVVVMKRDYRVMSANLGVCHSMASAGPSLLVTLGRDGVLRVMRVCAQQQHILLHLIWAGNRCYEKPLFGALQASAATPSAVCVFLPDASILRLAVCQTCDVVSVSAMAAAPKRDHVVVAAVTSAARGSSASENVQTQRSVVMYDDGCLSFLTETNSGFAYSSQAHVVSLNAQVRLLGLYDRWLLLSDGSSLRLFDCGEHHTAPSPAAAISSLMQEFPEINVVSHAVEPLSTRAGVEEHTVAASLVESSTVEHHHNADAASVQKDAAEPNSEVENKLLASEGAASPRSIASPRPQSSAGPVLSPDEASSPALPPSDANETQEQLLQVFKARCVPIVQLELMCFF